MKKKYFKKKGKSGDLLGKATETGAAMGGGLVAAAVSKPIAEKVHPMLGGAIPTLLGVGLDLFTEDANLRAAGKGMAAVGVTRVVAQIGKEGKLANTLGLQFFKKQPKGASTGTSGTDADLEYQRMLQAAAQDAMSGSDGYDDDYDEDDDI